MLPLMFSRERVSISKRSSTPLSTTATRYSSSAATLTSMDFDIRCVSPWHPAPSSDHRNEGAGASRGGLDRDLRRHRAPGHISNREHRRPREYSTGPPDSPEAGVGPPLSATLLTPVSECPDRSATALRSKVESQGRVGARGGG